jgi:AraC family transcriptional activator of pobA
MHENKQININPKNVSLLYWGYDTQNRKHIDRRHSHGHWQVDFICKGSVEMECGSENFNLINGNIIAIPPGTRHRYSYGEKTMSNWSVKFSVDNLKGKFKPAILPDNMENTIIRSALIEFFSKAAPTGNKKERNFIHYTRNEAKSPLGVHLLSALIEKNFSGADKLTEMPTASRVAKIIRENNARKITAESIAGKIGYSKGHLCCLIKNETGISLKAFIDKERFETAKNLLAYSELNISETAEKLDFNDVFHFSNFFKRMSGERPGEFLKKRN